MSSRAPAGGARFGAFLLVLLVGGLLYAGSAFSKRTAIAPAQGGADTSLIPDGLATDTPVPAPSGQPKPAAAVPPVFYVNTVSNGAQLMRRDASGQETVLFVDADQASKLTSVLGIADAAAIAVLTGANGQLSLASIRLDGSGAVTTLNPSFGGIAGGALRPARSAVSYVSFDNAERSFGFSLVSEGLDGGNRTVVDQDAHGLSLPAWSQTGDSLAYVKGQAGPESSQELWTAKNNLTPTRVASFDAGQVVTDLVWLDSHTVLAVLEPHGDTQQNDAATWVVHVDSGERQPLFDLPGKERSLAVSADGAWLAAVVGDTGASSAVPVGKLMTIELMSGKQATYGAATSVGGWSK